MARLNIALAFLLLSSCATAPAYVNACPVAPAYTKSFEQQAAVELAALPDNSAIGKMVTDYIAVRKELRDCK